MWGSSKFGVLGGFTDDDNEASLRVRSWVPCEGSQSYQELKSILPRALLYLPGIVNSFLLIWLLMGDVVHSFGEMDTVTCEEETHISLLEV